MKVIAGVDGSDNRGQVLQSHIHPLRLPQVACRTSVIREGLRIDGGSPQETARILRTG